MAAAGAAARDEGCLDGEGFAGAHPPLAGRHGAPDPRGARAGRGARAEHRRRQPAGVPALARPPAAGGAGLVAAGEAGGAVRAARRPGRVLHRQRAQPAVAV